jgi:hypothetical protein
MAFNGAGYFRSRYNASAYFLTGSQVQPVPEPPAKGDYHSGGGTGFERQGRIRVIPQGSRTYKDKFARDPRTIRDERDVIEFVIRFTTNYL